MVQIYHARVNGVIHSSFVHTYLCACVSCASLAREPDSVSPMFQALFKEFTEMGATTYKVSLSDTLSICVSFVILPSVSIYRAQTSAP